MRPQARRRVAAMVVAGVVGMSCGGNDRARGSLVSIGAGLRGPAGLTATVFARGLRAMSAFAVDSQGRLWIATADYSDAGKDGVYVVAQRDAAPVKVIDALHTPLGLLWYGDALYVSSISGVDAYRRFDGTKFAQHQAIVTWPEKVGQNNNLVLAPDGRMLLGISAPCNHCTPSSQWSATIVSFRPDGSDLRVNARGIRAGVGLTLFPGTSDLFVAMNQRDDLGNATTGDALAVVHAGESWGFPGCYGQGGAPCAGVPDTVATLDKHAAVAGVAIVTGELGARVGPAALVTEWATGKVQQVRLSKTASGYRSTVEPFLSGLKNPMPVVVLAGGSVLVGDWTTGTVYEIAGPMLNSPGK